MKKYLTKKYKAKYILIFINVIAVGMLGCSRCEVNSDCIDGHDESGRTTVFGGFVMNVGRSEESGLTVFFRWNTEEPYERWSALAVFRSGRGSPIPFAAEVDPNEIRIVDYGHSISWPPPDGQIHILGPDKETYSTGVAVEYFYAWWRQGGGRLDHIRGFSKETGELFEKHSW